MKTTDPQIANNTLADRQSLVQSLTALLDPLELRYTPGKTGLRLGATGVTYEERIAQLEGYSRVLWGLAPLLAGGAESPIYKLHLEGLRHGIDPSHQEFWGFARDGDQRSVEMAAFALAVLIAPKHFWEPLTEEEKDRFAAWLASINGKRMPPCNWEFFRVLVNVALFSLGRDYDPIALETSLDFLESLYVDDGWYRDEVAFDLYNPWAFHFYGLIYAVFMGHRDPARAARFRERARLFASQYLAWFSKDGSTIPFGRSLTYRFAAVSFFSACAFANEEVIPWASMRSLILGHLRNWFSRPILDHEGILSIGYSYPNLILAERYNSPTSPYWALKAYLILALPQSHPFWSTPDSDNPDQAVEKFRQPLHLKVPGMIICDHGEGSRYLLSAGQYPRQDHNQLAAKYAKFAYSSRFGFSLAQGDYGLDKTGCDSMLVLSQGDGWWRERREVEVLANTDEFLWSRWKPWSKVEIETWLAPFGCWHVRIHRIVSDQELLSAEGGFALPDTPASAQEPPLQIEGVGGSSVIISNSQGASFIQDLSPVPRRSSVLGPLPNVNVLSNRVRIPILEGKTTPGSTVFAIAVLAGDNDMVHTNKEEFPRFDAEHFSIHWKGRRLCLPKG